MGDEPRFEVSCVADGIGRIGDVQVFRENKFDVPDGNILAGVFGKGICMVGIPAGGQGVYRGFQIADGSNQVRILYSHFSKADNTDAAAGADLSVLCVESHRKEKVRTICPDFSYNSYSSIHRWMVLSMLPVKILLTCRIKISASGFMPFSIHTMTSSTMPRE